MEGASRGYHAIALYKLGRTDEALAEIELAVAIARGALQILPFNLAAQADMELGLGRVEAALEHARAALEAFRETRSDDGREIYVRVTYARALAASGLTDEARAHLAKAHRKLTERMALIREPYYRACFERIEENALVLAWAARER